MEMIDNGNGTFTINNAKTGQTKTVSGAELPKYGLSAPDSYSQGSFERGIGKTGLYDVPVLGGALRAVTHPILKGAEVVAEAVPATSEMITGTNKGQAYKPQFISGEQQQAFSGSLGEATTQNLKNVAGIGAFVVPGGGFAGGLTMKGLAGAGVASGFAESKNTIGDTLGGTVAGGVLGPALAKIPGLGGKAVKKTYQTVTKSLPENVLKTRDAIQKQLVALENHKMTEMVGYPNISKAKSLGITPDSEVEDVVRIVTPELETVGEQLNKVLTQDYATATMQEVRDSLIKAQKSVAPGVKEIDLTDFANRTDDFIRQNLFNEYPDMTPSQIDDMMQNRLPISLGVINKIKIRMGERFGDDPLYKEAYKNLQGLIENNSGDSAQVKALNQEYNTLREMKTTAQDRIDRGLTSTLENYDIKRDQIINKPLMNPVLGALASIGGVGLVAGAPVAAVPGATFAAYRVLANLLRDPVIAAKFANIVAAPRKVTGSKAAQVTEKGIGKIGKVLEQAGVRLPS